VTGKIFINYRRDDSAPHALSISQYLEGAFGRRNVFIDIDRMRAGQKFPEVLERRLAECKVMVTVIGPGWLDARLDDGRRRLDDPADWVRLEIVRALSREITVIPVTVGGAKLPQKSELPEELRPLLDYHAVTVTTNSFRSDMAGLLNDIQAIPESSLWRPQIGAGFAAVIFLAASIWGTTYLLGPSSLWFLWTGAADRVPVMTAATGERLLKAGGGNEEAERFKDCEANETWCPEMVVAPAGRFLMGSPADEEGHQGSEDDGKGKQVEVTIPRPLAVGRFAVTVGEFKAFIGEVGRTMDGCEILSGSGWRRDATRSWNSPGFDQTDRHPVTCVNWTDAKAYVDWLSKKTGKTYRLLSEAEREYVTRAGSTTPFWWGSSISTDQANYHGNVTYGNGPKGEFRGETVPVASFAANFWGLYQVHGNVWEWTEDCWNNSNQGNSGNGSARRTGDCNSHVVRGGTWHRDPEYLRSATRFRMPAGRYNDVGFRVARTL
jgi:formylglycine-generating enzyme required for sulfatase activity